MRELEVYATHPKTPDWRWLITGEPQFDQGFDEVPGGFDYANDSIIWEKRIHYNLWELKNPIVQFWHQSTLGAGPTHRVTGKKQIASAILMFWGDIEAEFNLKLKDQT